MEMMEFIQEHVNLEMAGMEEVKMAVAAWDWVEAGKKLAQYMKSQLDPQRFFSIPYEAPENAFTLPGESEEEAAARICRHQLVSCGMAHAFGERVDWMENPTSNQYREWTWQLNRHNEWKLLAHLYRKTGREELASTCADLFLSWYQQAPCPMDAPGEASLCWRTIECGIRMGANWPYVLHAFYESPFFTDQVILAWHMSIWEHGKRLRNRHRHGNWLLMEMNGLAHIGLLFPFFRESQEWLSYAASKMEKEISLQFYPDGFQYELSTCYHEVAVNNCLRLARLAGVYGLKLPKGHVLVLEQAAQVDVKLMMPDGTVPDINDGFRKPAARLLAPKTELFGDNLDIRWGASGGKEGHPPAYTSVALACSGYLVMRTGWDEKATWALFDAGPFGRGHQHEDKLSLLVFANGKLVLAEGGNYAYDDSQMRRYVLSSWAHNTVLVDGKGQNRRKGYGWMEEDIRKPSGMSYGLGDGLDYGEGRYEEGYGEECDRSVSHGRRIYFLKALRTGLDPFFLVVDRMDAVTDHEYQVLWHLDGEKLSLESGAAGQKVEAGGMALMVSHPGAAWEACRGKRFPHWQGFTSTGTVQGAYRPVYQASCLIQGSSCRWVTLLYPLAEGKHCPVARVEASKDPRQEKVVLWLEHGEQLELDEAQMRERAKGKNKGQGSEN